ncbi:MAG: hypothetical protein ACK5BQ_01755 [Ignavibacteria bacterium]|jgi:hypothetical protein
MALLATAHYSAIGQNGTGLRVARSVMSSGGRMMSTSLRSIDGTIGQLAIGITRDSTVWTEQGFWYSSRRIYDGNGWHTTISVPHVRGRNGQTLEIPITMRSTDRMRIAGLRDWTLRVKFNKSMLQPLNINNVQETDDSYLVTFMGQSYDTVETLADLKVFVRLGNDSITPVEVDSFAWHESDRMRIYKEDGSFTDESVCQAGGPRLLAVAGHPTLRVTPQPLVDRGEANGTIGTEANVRLILYTADGQAMSTLFAGRLPAGDFRIPFEIGAIANGTYLVALETPTHSVATQIIVLR